MCLDKPDMLVVARCIHTNQTYFFLHDLLLSEFVFNLCFLCSPALVPPFYSIKLCLYLCLYFMFFFIEVGRRGVISDFTEQLLRPPILPSGRGAGWFECGAFSSCWRTCIFNQSISLYLHQAKAHTQTDIHTDTHACTKHNQLTEL